MRTLILKRSNKRTFTLTTKLPLHPKTTNERGGEIYPLQVLDLNLKIPVIRSTGWNSRMSIFSLRAVVPQSRLHQSLLSYLITFLQNLKSKTEQERNWKSMNRHFTVNKLWGILITLTHYDISIHLLMRQDKWMAYINVYIMCLLWFCDEIERVSIFRFRNFSLMVNFID